MTELAAKSPQHTRLLGELETMLREQLELKPNDLKLRLRLTTVLAELGRREAFLVEAQIVHKLLRHQPTHPVLTQITKLAATVGVDANLFQAQTDHGPQRRLGEDAGAKAYFEKLDRRFKELKEPSALIRGPRPESHSKFQPSVTTHAFKTLFRP